MNANQLKTLDGWTGEVYSPNDPPWPSQLKAGLGLVMMMMKMVIMAIMNTIETMIMMMTMSHHRR